MGGEGGGRTSVVRVCGQARRRTPGARRNGSQGRRRRGRSGPAGPGRGGQLGEDGAAGALGLWPSSPPPWGEAPQTAGSPTAGEGRGRRRRHSGDSRRSLGLRCPAQTWRLGGVQLSLPGAPGILQESLGLGLMGLGEFCPAWGSSALS